MLKNSTVKIILAVGIIILIVAATFAYGNSQRQAQQANNKTSNKPASTSQSASPSSANTPASSSASSTPAPSQSPIASATPQIAPPSGAVPQTGGELLYAVPVTGLGILMYTRRQGRQQLSRQLKQTT